MIVDNEEGTDVGLMGVIDPTYPQRAAVCDLDGTFP